MKHHLKHALAGLAAVTGIAAENKRAKHLPEAAKKELRALQKDLSASRAKAVEEFLSRYPQAAPQLPRSAIRRVVSSFVINDFDETDGVQATGDNKLVVKGNVVAERPAAFSKYMRVCPGEFGSDKTSRRVANELLSVMSAGIRVDDRNGRAFLDPIGKGRGRIISPNACYTVEVTSKIRHAANKNVQEALRAGGAFYEGAKGAERVIGSEPMTAEEKANLKKGMSKLKRTEKRLAKKAAEAAAKAKRSKAAKKAAKTRKKKARKSRR